MTGEARSVDRNRHAGTLPHAGRASVSVRALQPLLLYLKTRGHDTAVFLTVHGVDPTLFRDPEARLPHVTAATLWPSATRLTNDPDLGLHVAEGVQVQPGNYGVLGYVVSTSENLGIGLQRLAQYTRFLHDSAEIKLTVQRDRAVLSHTIPVPGGLPRPFAEYIVATWLLTFRQATAVNWSPLEVRFQHAAPDNTSEHRRIFGCIPEFEHHHNELVFARELLKVPMAKADAALQQILETQLVAVIERLPKGEATTDAVRRLLATELSEGQPTLEQIAPRLHMSARTLHRRLEGEGTSFRQVLTEVRREVAARHLSEGRLAIGEIAFLLGFSEPSAFHRAFKRWTGHGPVTYRELAQTAS